VTTAAARKRAELLKQLLEAQSHARPDKQTQDQTPKPKKKASTRARTDNTTKTNTKPQKSEPKTKRQQERSANRKNEGARSGRSRVTVQVSDLSQDEIDRVRRLFDVSAVNRQALEAVEPHVPAIWNAVIRGAMIPGNQGAADRSTLWRMLGVPWQAGQAGTPGKLTVEIGERLATALARSGRVNGQSHDTLGSNRLTDAKFPAEIDGEAHQIADLLPVSDPATNGSARQVDQQPNAHPDLGDDRTAPPICSLEGE
jgi:DNA mismatch repair ATPase MutL